MWGFCIFVVSGIVIYFALLQFVIAVVTDPQIPVSHTTLERAVQQFPQSASLQTRLAARLIEAGVSRSEPFEDVARQALAHASQAASLAPWKYEPRVLLAAAREFSGDLTQAEKDLRTALTLAPQRPALRWRLANLLLRQGNLAAAQEEFRVVAVDASLLAKTLPLLWAATNADVTAVAAVAEKTPLAQMVLARFFAQQSQAATAVSIATQLPREALWERLESSQLLDSLLAAKEFVAADQFWRHLWGKPDGPIWNGSFELAARKGFGQFDWQLADNRYVRLSLTPQHARTGTSALSLEYQGKETTRLDEEIKQLIVVKPGARYRLTGYAKADSFVTSDGPRLVVTKIDANMPLAETATVLSGSHDWQLLSVDFVAPAGVTALMVSIKQTPRFSYAPPTQGTVWFDDISLREP